MPGGKPAGVRCAQLTAANRCRLYGSAERPPVCSGLQPSEEMCRGTVEEIFVALADLEQSTRPERQRARPTAGLD